MLTRLIAGALLAAAVGLAGYRGNALSRSGAIAAAAVGTLACLAGWDWAAVLFAFFIPSVALSSWRRASKQTATRDVVEKSAARDAVQVLANGGVFALAALAQSLDPSVIWTLVGLGALSAATADTWATEVGTAIGGVPRSIVGMVSVPVGTSGAVTWAGSAAMALGSLWLGTAALALGSDLPVAVAVMTGGIGGALADTLLGAFVQERRWCQDCQGETEQRTHHCGSRTVHRRGVRGFGNDAVNLTSTATGAAIAVLWSLF